MTERGEVDPDLVRPPGVEVTTQKRMAAPSLDDGVARARIAPAAHHRHSLAILRMPPDRALELARVVVHAAAHDGEVDPAESPVAELRRKGPVARVVARDDDEPRRPFVETMNDARPRDAAGGGPHAAASEQRVDERAGLVAGSRVHDHAGRFVDHRDVVVPVQDLERDVLGHRRRLVCLRHLDFNDVTWRDAVGGLSRPSVEPDQVALDQARGGSAAQVGSLLGDEAVQPQRRGDRGQLAGLRMKLLAMRSTTPTEIAESATLNTGQKWTFTKSVTVP